MTKEVSNRFKLNHDPICGSFLFLSRSFLNHNKNIIQSYKNEYKVMLSIFFFGKFIEDVVVWLSKTRSWQVSIN